MDDSFPDRARFCCLNPHCLLFGFRNSPNLSVCGHINQAKTIRQLYCGFCKKRFSERKGTVFYHSRLPGQKILSILRHVQEGNGMRQTGRLVGTKEDTVIRYARKAGRHAESLHRHLVAFSPSHPGSAGG